MPGPSGRDCLEGTQPETRGRIIADHRLTIKHFAPEMGYPHPQSRSSIAWSRWLRATAVTRAMNGPLACV
jgi:hypothetical protein